MAISQMVCYGSDITGENTSIWSGLATKKFRRSDTPFPWILGVEVWSVGQKSRFFDLRWGPLGCCVVPNIFVAASYRITWPGRKNLGDGGTFPASVGAQKHLKRKIGGFRNDPQMSFWETGCRECIGARQQYDQKNFRPWRCFLIPWSFPDDKNSLIYRNLECGVFFPGHGSYTMHKRTQR